MTAPQQVDYARVVKRATQLAAVSSLPELAETLAMTEEMVHAHMERANTLDREKTDLGNRVEELEAELGDRTAELARTRVAAAAAERRAVELQTRLEAAGPGVPGDDGDAGDTPEGVPGEG